MEILMIQSRNHFEKPNVSKMLNSTISSNTVATTEESNKTQKFDSVYTTNMTMTETNDSSIYDLLNGTTNSSDFLADYDFQLLNATIEATGSSWSTCKEWGTAQHTLFQAANFFFAAAFLIPSYFKQSVLLVRALITIGYLLLMSWAGMDVCTPDILAWCTALVVLNFTHTCLLTMRFLPPTLTLELTELYMKMFKPLKVSKKHFKELVREGQICDLERGDIYAVEDASPADEKLSILLKGKMRVTCDDTHLHFISVHQFVDSPEWEANHEQSDDVFQVTVTAEEDCVYMCWSRMKLERFLRHRPLLKVVLDSIIGKDITQKLYSLNEHLTGLTAERKREKSGEQWTRAHNRSMSVDAVNTGTTGFVRSEHFLDIDRQNSFINGSSEWKQHTKFWAPFAVSQFPVISPFTKHHQQADNDSAKSLLRLPEPATPQRTRSLRRNREVKFQN